MTTAEASPGHPTTAFSNSPTVHHIYAPSTGTWQYIIADETTSRCIVLDPVRDVCSDPAAMSTSSADAIIAVVKENGYTVDYILETHAADSQRLSGAWYLRMQLSIVQGHAPQLCNEATVTGLELMWQRKYGAGSHFSTSIRAGLEDGERITFGFLSVVCMHMTGFGSPHRRAYLVGNDLFGAHSIATSEVEGRRAAIDFNAQGGPGRSSAEGESSEHLDAWKTTQRIFALPPEVRIWREQGHDVAANASSQPCDTVSRCAALNRHAKLSESEYLANRRAESASMLEREPAAKPKGGWKAWFGAKMVA